MLEEYSFQELLKIGMYTQLMENKRRVFRRHTVIRSRLQVILNRATIFFIQLWLLLYQSRTNVLENLPMPATVTPVIEPFAKYWMRWLFVSETYKLSLESIRTYVGWFNWLEALPPCVLAWPANVVATDDEAVNFCILLLPQSAT